jgi:flavodoxin
MKSLVVYYSRTGVTKKVAEAVAGSLGSDIEEIIDQKDRRGIWGWLMAGRDATLKKLVNINSKKQDPSNYDLVVIGTPVWAWTLTPAIRAYIAANCANFKKVAFFLTMSGACGSTFKTMEELCGKKPLAVLDLRETEVRKDKHIQKIKNFANAIFGK